MDRPAGARWRVGSAGDELPESLDPLAGRLAWPRQLLADPRSSVPRQCGRLLAGRLADRASLLANDPFELGRLPPYPRIGGRLPHCLLQNSARRERCHGLRQPLRRARHRWSPDEDMPIWRSSRVVAVRPVTTILLGRSEIRSATLSAATERTPADWLPPVAHFTVIVQRNPAQRGRFRPDPLRAFERFRGCAEPAAICWGSLNAEQTPRRAMM